MKSQVENTPQADDFNKEVYEKIYGILKDIQFGSITISVQNGRIVHVEKNEKYRVNEL